MERETVEWNIGMVECSVNDPVPFLLTTATDMDFGTRSQGYAYRLPVLYSLAFSTPLDCTR